MRPTTPPEAETQELIAQLAELARTPLSKPDAIALRREARAGLAALGLAPPAQPLERRRRWNATSHVRERLPRR
jgi:hypothetical protein